MEQTKHEKWIHNKWRPFMAWTYMITCFFDFVISPYAYAAIQVFTIENIAEIASWSPLTLQGGGLYHFSMMAIVGVTAYGRTQEKMKNISDKLGVEFPLPESDQK